MLLDEELARTLKRNGVEGVHRHYSVGRMADRTMSLYGGLQNSRDEKHHRNRQGQSKTANTCRGVSFSSSSSSSDFPWEAKTTPERCAFFPLF